MSTLPQSSESPQAERFELTERVIAAMIVAGRKSSVEIGEEDPGEPDDPQVLEVLRAFADAAINAILTPSSGEPPIEAKRAIQPRERPIARERLETLAQHFWGECFDEDAEAITTLLSDYDRLQQRLAELPDFLDALDEWGCESNEARANAIEDFLASETGLEEYRDGFEHPPSVEGV